MATEAASAGPVQLSVVEKLRSGIDGLEHLDVANVSHTHNVPPGSETHFNVVAVSSAFEGMKLVDRHRLINSLLAEELSSEGPIHALSITAKTVVQWEKSAAVHKTPPCLGGDGSLPSR